MAHPLHIHFLHSIEILLKRLIPTLDWLLSRYARKFHSSFRFDISIHVSIISIRNSIMKRISRAFTRKFKFYSRPRARASRYAAVLRKGLSRAFESFFRASARRREGPLPSSVRVSRRGGGEKIAERIAHFSGSPLFHRPRAGPAFAGRSATCCASTCTVERRAHAAASWKRGPSKRARTRARFHGATKANAGERRRGKRTRSRDARCELGLSL